MPPTPRKELQEALCRYATETLAYIDTVRGFCEKSSKWMLCRESEVEMMMDIKYRADRVDLNISHVTQSENKGEALLEYMRSKLSLVSAHRRLAELEKELTAMLADTLEGLEKLHRFLEAVERLAVTSLHVFTEAGRELGLPTGIDLQRVQVVVAIARLICPLVQEFKRDASVFFLPRLQNVEVMAYQLDQYIKIAQRVCNGLDIKKELQEALCRYATETLPYIDAVRGFRNKSSKWMLYRESEVEKMMDIKKRADHVHLNISQVTQSENKGEALKEYMMGKLSLVSAHRRLAELEKELAAVLADTLEGLEKLHRFLDAVVKLAVTSLHVFTEAGRELGLPAGIDFQRVQVVVANARLICPLVQEFKRDAGVLILPGLQNVEVLTYQLKQYIKIAQRVCDGLDTRKELQEALCRYATETLAYIDTVRGFCEKSSKWMLCRESEVEMMMDIKDRADRVDLNISHVTQSENKGEALLEYVRSKLSLVSADSRRGELEKELAAVLANTLEGLEKLHRFLDAVEKLAVTSLHVFTYAGLELGLPTGIDLQRDQVVVTNARLICPLLLEFKRDAGVFFLPRLQNVEVLAYQLDQYIKTAQRICDGLDTSCFRDFSSKINMKTVAVDSSQDDVVMLRHINQLEAIRMNQNFRTVFLFQDMSSGFIAEFGKRQARMLQFLRDLEESAVQLDKMNKGARISSVAGSSLGVVGGVLSIIGLALIPVTAGVSLTLTMIGIGMGVTSGVNSLVTTATEMGVNHTQQKKANEAFRGFMEDVLILQDCLEEVVQKGMTQVDVALGVGKVLFTTGGIARGIDFLIDAASAAKLLRSEEAIVSASRVAVQEGKALSSASRVASDIPDIGQAAVKGPLALSQTARAGLIAANALFLGLDVFFICKDSVSLSKGSETKVSRYIRARAALWRSEMDSWQRIHDALRDGLLTSEENRAILQKPFIQRRRRGGNERNDNGS